MLVLDGLDEHNTSVEVLALHGGTGFAPNDVGCVDEEFRWLGKAAAAVAILRMRSVLYLQRLQSCQRLYQFLWSLRETVGADVLGGLLVTRLCLVKVVVAQVLFAHATRLKIRDDGRLMGIFVWR